MKQQHVIVVLLLLTCYCCCCLTSSASGTTTTSTSRTNNAAAFLPASHHHRPPLRHCPRIIRTSCGIDLARTTTRTSSTTATTLTSTTVAASTRETGDHHGEDDKSNFVGSNAAKNATQSSHEQVRDYRNALSILPRSTTGDDDGGGGGQELRRTKDVTMKFGGSSLADAERIQHVTRIIENQIAHHGIRPRAVVCSALGKTTNALLSAGDYALDGHDGASCIRAIRALHESTMERLNTNGEAVDAVNALLDECRDMLNGIRLIQELSPKSLDQLVSYGERCSVRIVAAELNRMGVPAIACDAWDVGVYTDAKFGDASLLPTASETIRTAFDRLDPDAIAVVTGFLGRSPQQDNRITTLGRGGSDLTATALGAALDGIDEIQVWKDVDGILSGDPRMVNNPVPIPAVSYEEASELAYFGAQVLHPIAMQPAMAKNIPVRVKNSYNPDAPGTLICDNGNNNSRRRTTTNDDDDDEGRSRRRRRRLVTAITCKRNIKLLDIQSTLMLGAYGFLARVFGDFAKRKLSVDVLASSEVSVSLTLDQKQNDESLRELLRDLDPYAQVTVKRDKSILTLIANVQESSKVLAEVFAIFSRLGIRVEMMSQGASKVNISFILNGRDLDLAFVELHKRFFEDDDDEQSTTRVVAAEDDDKTTREQRQDQLRQQQEAAATSTRGRANNAAATLGEGAKEQ